MLILQIAAGVALAPVLIWGGAWGVCWAVAAGPRVMVPGALIAAYLIAIAVQ